MSKSSADALCEVLNNHSDVIKKHETILNSIMEHNDTINSLIHVLHTRIQNIESELYTEK